MKAYVYGAKAPVENVDVVREQLRLAHQYRNKLVEVGQRYFDAREAVLQPRREAWAKETERLKAEAVARGEDASRVKAPKPPPLSEEEKAKLAAAKAAWAEETKAARAASGLYWGTYLLAEDAALRAVDSGQRPRFRRWDGSGTLGVQIQGGLSADELLSGEDTRVRLVGEGKRRRLYLRVGSEGRSPVWAVFPIVWHRELPEGARIKWVRVACRRVATHTKWSATFVVDTKEAPAQAPRPGAVAVDVGWRMLRNGDMRVAYWVDDAGRAGQLVLPRRLLERDAKVSDLRSIRDKHFNEALAALCRVRDAGELPEELRAELQYAHQWRSPARLAAVALRWRDKREGLSASASGAIEALEAWRKRDKHLYEWEAHQRENVLRARREIYRVFARQMADTYGRIVLEQLDLRDFAESKETVGSHRRFDAALSELLGCIKNAAADAGTELVREPSADTTRTCHQCGVVDDFDAAKELLHTCSGCGAVWDQDENAARNLLRAAMSDGGSSGRSNGQAAEAPKETRAALRRRAALETKRRRALEKRGGSA